MLRLNKTKIKGRDISVGEFRDLVQHCLSCGRDLPIEEHFESCVLWPDIEYKCGQCGAITKEEDVEYSAEGPQGAYVAKVLSAHRCPQCNHLYIDDWLFGPSHVEWLIKGAPPGFRIVPEQGIQTSSYLEIFSPFYDEHRRTVRKQFRGVEVRFGPQGRVFHRVANDVTELDLDDHGLSEHYTLRIKPPPPYSEQQRQNLHVVMAQIRLFLDLPDESQDALGSAVLSVHKPSTKARLLGAILKWRDDENRQALSLANAIYADGFPGAFFNAFRLLEMVLERLLDREIADSRRVSTVSDRQFADLVKTHNSDLKTRLRQRVGAMAVFPRQILDGLWQALRPGESFNPQEVFSEIVKFRNRYAHGSLVAKFELALPWEDPPFGLITEGVLDLVTAMVESGS